VGLASLAYVALPVGVFLAGWLRPAAAVPAVAALALAVGAWAAAFRRPAAAAGGPAGDGPADAAAARVGAGTLWLACAAAGLLVWLGGPGGLGIQQWDWAKHNAILLDLVEQPWPVAYRTAGGDSALTYYVAYYLPAALAGKAAGWRVANAALAGWTAVGCLLAALWLVVLARAPGWLAPAVLVLFSGLDVVGAALWSDRWAPGAWVGDFHVEWWAGSWVYPANVSLIAFAPGQAVGGWLLAALVADALRARPARCPVGLAGALALLWSPLAALGLAALAAGTWLAGRVGWRALARGQAGWANVAGAGVGALLALYLAARLGEVPLSPWYDVPPDRRGVGGLALVPALVPAGRFAADYAVFLALEVLAVAVPVAVILRGSCPERRLLAGSLATLAALPFVAYGYWNDLAMRASIPALFVLQALAVRACRTPGAPRAWRAALAVALALGALGSANLLRLHAAAVAERGRLSVILPRGAVPSLFEQQLAMRETYRFRWLHQYLGRLDAPFFRYLARPTRPVEREAVRRPPGGDPGPAGGARPPGR
jgi:hypothetical protein